MTGGRLVEILRSHPAEHVALLAPDRPAITYGQLATRVAELGAAQPGRVVLTLPNGPDLAVAFLGAVAGGGCAPLPVDLPAAEVDRALQALDAAEGEIPEEAALLLFTSGTTGAPKLITITEAQLLASADNVAATLRLGTDDRGLNLMPLCHIHGLVAGLLASLVAGGSRDLHAGVRRVRASWDGSALLARRGTRPYPRSTKRCSRSLRKGSCGAGSGSCGRRRPRCQPES